jgi:hypothetical protein
VTAYRADGGRLVLDRAGDTTAVRDVRVTDDAVDDEPRDVHVRG